MKATDEELAEEARKWDSGELTPAGWHPAPDAVPRPRLGKLLEGITDENIHPEVDFGPPVGNEEL